MPIYKITPHDVLFFRDARPMSGSSSGHGARWPEPNILFNAIHAALHRAYPDQPGEWEHLHRSGKSGTYTETRDKRFGSLQIFGPYPIKEGHWYFPRPQDVVTGGHYLPIKEAMGKSNLPEPLQYPLAGTAAPSKEIPPDWWDKVAMEAYLRHEQEGLRIEVSDLYSSEWATGIGIDSDTQTQDGKRLYSAEYLRLKEGVHLGLAAALPLKNGDGDGLARLFSEPNHIVVGGQQRVCRVEEAQVLMDHVLPVGPDIEGNKVKWVLLSPAVFPRMEKTGHPGGWLPSWVDYLTGKVMLTDGPGKNKIKRKGGALGRELDVYLVAARIPKPIAISGWSERKHLGTERGVTATTLAIPAGAVYFFEGPDAPKLPGLLNWHGKGRDTIANRRSALWGEQGFGIGVCGPWEAMGEEERPGTS